MDTKKIDSIQSKTDEQLEDKPPEEKEELLSVEHLHRLYIFAMTWSFGALLNAEDRLKLDVFVHDKFSDFDFPIEESQPDAKQSIFDYFVTKTGIGKIGKRLSQTTCIRNMQLLILLVFWYRLWTMFELTI